MNINSENHLLETKWSVNKNTNGTWTGHVNLGYQGSTSTFVYTSDYLRTLSNIRKLRATATLYFVTREENVPFHRRTFSQAFRHPSSQRFHMAAMKGKGDPKKDLSVLKWTHSMAWLCFNNLVLSMEKNVHYIFIFQVSSTSGDWYYQYSVLTAVQTTYGTYGQAGSSHRVLGRAVFSLYSARLQYNLTVLAPATLPAWPFLGILRSLASA